MERPFEVQHVIGFIEGGGVTQYSQSQMLAVVEYVEQLETRVAELSHKADQYDSIVAALKVADGGRYRNDTIDALLSRLARIAELEDAIEYVWENSASPLSIEKRILLTIPDIGARED